MIDLNTGEIRVHNGEELKFQGQAKLVDYLRENQDIADELETLIRGGSVELPDGERVDEDGYGDTETASAPAA
ncbi:hypothetical protein AAAC51_06780 [Priestia megaterium]